MANLFRSNKKVGVVYGSSPGLLSGISVGASSGDSGLSSVGILITGVALSQGVRISYFTTLSESIYVYPLGNKVGKCMITGIALPGCNGESEDRYTNLEKLMKFYEQYKASKFENVERPIKITIGSVVISGFLEDIQVNITNETQVFGAATFSLTLSVLPEMTAS